MKRTSPRCDGSTTDTPGTAKTGTPLQGGPGEGLSVFQTIKPDTAVSIIVDERSMARQRGGRVGMRWLSLRAQQRRVPNLKGSCRDLPGLAPRSCSACCTCAARSFAHERNPESVKEMCGWAS